MCIFGHLLLKAQSNTHIYMMKDFIRELKPIPGCASKPFVFESIPAEDVAVAGVDEESCPEGDTTLSYRRLTNIEVYFMWRFNPVPGGAFWFFVLAPAELVAVAGMDKKHKLYLPPKNWQNLQITMLENSTKTVPQKAAQIYRRLQI